MFRLPITRTGFAIGIGLLAFCHHGGVSVAWCASGDTFRTMTSIIAATRSGHRGDDVRMSESSGRAGAPWALRGTGRRVGSAAVAGVRRWWLAGLAQHCTRCERNPGECARGLRRAGDARARYPCPARQPGERSARRSVRRCGDRARTRTARSACRNDRRLQPGDRDRGDRSGRTRAGRELAVSRGSSHRFQRPRIFHRPAQRRCAIPDRRRRAWPAVADGRVHRRDSPRRSDAFRRRHPGRRVARAISASSISEMFGGDPDYTAHVLREDGTPIAGYPETTPAEGSQRDQLLADVIAQAVTGRTGARHVVGRRHRARRSPIAGWRIIRSTSRSAVAGVR